MKIEIERLNQAFHMRAHNENGASIDIDSSTDHGGNDLGFRPMQLLLAGIGGCSAIDIIEILRKQRQDLQDIKITIDGEREKGKTPALWETIHIHYRLYGLIDANKAKQAIELSINKYCSVAKTLESTAKITYSFELISV
jgi:putative redox protein